MADLKNPAEKSNFVQVLDQSCVEFADRPMFACLGKALDYGEVDLLSRRFAAYLQNRTGLQPGDRIAVQLSNLLQYPVAVYGILRAGFTVVTINPRCRPRELLHQFNDCGVRALVVLADLMPIVEQILPQSKIEHVFDSGALDLHAPHSGYDVPGSTAFIRILETDLPLHPVALEREHLALLQYSPNLAGTVVKKRAITHSDLLAMTLRANALGRGSSGAEADICLFPQPLHKLRAFLYAFTELAPNGHLGVLVPDPYNVDMLFTELKRWSFTSIAGSEAIFRNLRRHPGIRKLNLGDLTETICHDLVLYRTAEGDA